MYLQKHRLFQTRAEWCRLQNIRYLIKFLCSRIKQKPRNDNHISDFPSEPAFSDIYDPIELIEDSDLASETKHSDYSISMHEPED